MNYIEDFAKIKEQVFELSELTDKEIKQSLKLRNLLMRIEIFCDTIDSDIIVKSYGE